nr:hypothetical protein [uncultured Sediminibacterium sp.]
MTAELIMKISRYKSLKNFYRYIRITLEEAAGKIKEIWESRAKQAQAQAQPFEKMIFG